MQAVAAAWTMLQISHKADLVAMVQTASMLPVMLLAVVSGALADMYDRKRVAIAALTLSLSGASLLAGVAATGHISPTWILLCCFITGAGFALYLPAWQSSAVEIVGVKAMPAAVSLFSISTNAARSIGPALGGVVIAASGMVLAFSLNAVFYAPIIIALVLWKRKTVPSRLPPERLDRAMIAGLRFIQNSPAIRRVMLRSLITSMGGAAVYSMLPLVAHDKLHGGPGSYGILLGAFGLGAVIFALGTTRIRSRFTPEVIVRSCTIVRVASLLITAFSPSLLLSAVAMIGAGGALMLETASYNVAVQISSPRWVGGRALAMFQTTVAAGLAGGAVLWGRIATDQGVTIALCFAAALVLSSLLLVRRLSMAESVAAEAAPPIGSDPVAKMALTGRSGPVTIEVEYRVRSEDARIFYHAMKEFRRTRERNGAFNTTLARDIADPELWIERFHFPTWNDYLRARDRPTIDDHQVRERAFSFHIGSETPRIRRMLERPTGSVRWHEDVVDPGESVALPILVPSG